MNVLKLKKRLNELRIPEEAYSILEGGLPNEQLCIIRNDDSWEVYYSERGRKSGVKIFEDENKACEYFLEKLKKYSQLLI
jgi:hypothetical protein